MMMETQSPGQLYSRLPDNTYVHEGKAIKHRVPARDEGRVLVEVDVIPSNGAVLAAQYVPPGKHLLIAYLSELPAIEAQVRTAEEQREWERSVAMHEAALERHLAESNLGLKDVQKDPDLMPTRRKAIAVYGKTTAEGFLAQTYRTGIGVLTSCKVIATDLPPPETDVIRERKRAESLVEMISTALGKALAGTKSKVA